MPQTDWFARYKFLQPIGQGGMGTVFLAEDKFDNGATRVIKQMNHKAGDEFEQSEAVRLFKREAEILRTLNHSGVVHIYDSYASDEGKYFLVMDYIPGKNLDAIIASKGGPLTCDEVVKIAIQCCDVLEYLHCRDEPIIYRDLKPSNLMLTPEGRVIFIDFGIARLMPKEAATRVVTAGYSPPEQYFGRPELRSDIYSLGATLHHLLTGHRPKPLTACNPQAQNIEVLNSLNNLVRKMTAHEVEDRPSSAASVKYSLLKIYKEMHPEFEIPDWVHKNAEDEPDDKPFEEEGARLKHRNLSTARGAGSAYSHEMKVVDAGKGKADQHRAGMPYSSKSQAQGGAAPSSGNVRAIGPRGASGSNNPGPKRQSEPQDPITHFVDRVKKWFENTLKR